MVNVSVLFSQRKKYLGFELAGSYGLTGLSLDSRFSELSKFGYTVGLSYGFEYNSGANHWYLTPVKAYYPEDDRMNRVVSIPFNIHYLLGQQKNFLETGIGLCAFYADYKFGNNKGLGYYSFGRIAYRHESVTKRLSFSLGLDVPFSTPASGLGYSIGIAPALSIGYRL
ncbi:MAG: hypothetical protein PHH37_05670 [Paludibacter sp.]|nr:hypothetical protein [Paludibacter sp.]